MSYQEDQCLRFFKAILGVIWDVFLDANWDANYRPKQHQILKMDANNTIKSTIPWKSVHFFQKIMKNTLNVIVDAKKEAKGDANYMVLLQC